MDFTDDDSKSFGVGFNALFRSKHPIESSTLDDNGRTMFSVNNYIKAATCAFPKSEKRSETEFGKQLVKEIVNYGSRVFEIRNNYMDSVMDTAQNISFILTTGCIVSIPFEQGNVFRQKMVEIIDVFQQIHSNNNEALKKQEKFCNLT